MATSKPKPSAPAAAPASEAAPRPPSKLRWLAGWILIPLLFVSALFAVGVHVGARHPDMWLARGLLWMTGSEAQTAPPANEPGMATRMRLMVLPSKEFSLRVSLDDESVRELAEKTDKTPATIDCATACRAVWEKEHPDLEFLQATRCTVAESKDGKTGTLECDAKVQR